MPLTKQTGIACFKILAAHRLKITVLGMSPTLRIVKAASTLTSRDGAPLWPFC